MQETKNNWKKILSLTLYSIVVALLIFTIFILKSINAPSSPTLIYIYTIFVTTFMLSRVVASFFYKNPPEKVEKGKEPSVSFIIPSKNEGAAIYETIRRCAVVNYPKEKIDIVAINDGSTDNTYSEMLRAKKDFSNVKISVVNWEINRGKREGMVEGFRKARGEIVIQLDSDSFPDKDAVYPLVAPFSDKKVAAVVAHTDPANKDENLLTRMQTAYYFMAFRALKASESIFKVVFCCSGCCSAYKKSYVLPALEDFRNETFLGKKVPYGDDRALTNHMLKKGYHTIYSASAQAYTIVPNNVKQLFKQQVRWKKGWFINSVRASKFIANRDAFVGFTYFFPLMLVTLITPIIAFKALIVNPFILKASPLIYILGVLTISLLLFVHHKVYSDDKYGKYILLWSILNMFVLTYVIFYALFDLRNLSWGTR